MRPRKTSILGKNVPMPKWVKITVFGRNDLGKTSPEKRPQSPGKNVLSPRKNVPCQVPHKHRHM
jgi:hypothetical protein